MQQARAALMAVLCSEVRWSTLVGTLGRQARAGTETELVQQAPAALVAVARCQVYMCGRGRVCKLQTLAQARASRTAHVFFFASISSC